MSSTYYDITTDGGKHFSMAIIVKFKCVRLRKPPCGTPRITLYAVFYRCSLSLKYSELHAYLRPPRPKDLIAEHVASLYTQSYADVISRNTTIAIIGLLFALSIGNDINDVTVFLAEVRHLRRVYIAVGPVPVYAIEHNFFISYQTQLRREI